MENDLDMSIFYPQIDFILPLLLGLFFSFKSYYFLKKSMLHLSLIMALNLVMLLPVISYSLTSFDSRGILLPLQMASLALFLGLIIQALFINVDIEPKKNNLKIDNQLSKSTRAKKNLKVKIPLLLALGFFTFQKQTVVFYLPMVSFLILCCVMIVIEYKRNGFNETCIFFSVFVSILIIQILLLYNNLSEVVGVRVIKSLLWSLLVLLVYLFSLGDMKGKKNDLKE